MDMKINFLSKNHLEKHSLILRQRIQKKFLLQINILLNLFIKELPQVHLHLDLRDIENDCLINKLSFIFDYYIF